MLLISGKTGVSFSKKNDPFAAHKKIAHPSLQGREVAILSNDQESNFLTKITKEFLKTTALVVTHLPFISYVFRKLDQCLFTFVEELTSCPDYFDSLRKSTRTITGAIDCVQLASDVYYLADGQYKNDSELNIFGRIPFFIANLGKSLFWLERMDVINLSKIAFSMGNVQIFKWIPQVVNQLPLLKNLSLLQSFCQTLGELKIFSAITSLSLMKITMRATLLAHLLFASDALRRVIEPGNEAQKTFASLELLNYVADLSLELVILAGVTNGIALGIIGSLCLGVGFTCLGYHVIHHKQIEIHSEANSA